jgi:RNA-directed DNA polymerase
MSDILKTQRSFARKAQACKEHRFEDLYHLICRMDWIEEALGHVLSNTGARTAGIDGISKADLKTEEARMAFIKALQADLKSGGYQPMPVKRVWIPKPGKKEKRGLGIPTIRDRVVQELLRMLMEPIWESDFLECSNGFRPGRRTMDCIAVFYKRVTTSNKYLWAIEGDIRKCFDRIHHRILVRLIRQRIADRRIVALVDAFLTAGIMDGALFHQTTEGTPQGGILSPLLANIYLHQLDVWWWNRYGGLSRNEKRRRRNAGLGNAVLTRYADDFVILWNGTHQDALALRVELKHFLWDELRLELSEEKTHVTHMTDGIEFLGFHLQWRLSRNGRRPWLRVTPTGTNVKRFRAKIKALTKRNATAATPEMRFKSLNRLIRGWGNYYRHVSFTKQASKLDFWIARRVLIWLYNKHQRRGKRWLLRQYLRREKTGRYNRKNFGVEAARGGMVYLALLSDIPHSPYHPRKRENPYLTAEDILIPDEPETPLLEPRLVNLPPGSLAWRNARAKVLKRDGHRCVRCGTHQGMLDVHHVRSPQEGGTRDLGNLVTMCRSCHTRTVTYGWPKREEKV